MRHDRTRRASSAEGRYIADYFAEHPGRPVEEAEVHRKHRNVRCLRREGVTDFDALFDFLACPRTNEAATVQRARRVAGGGG